MDRDPGITTRFLSSFAFVPLLTASLTGVDKREGEERMRGK